MSIKVGCISHDMRILGRIVGVRSTEQSVGIIIEGFDRNGYKSPDSYQFCQQATGPLILSAIRCL